MIKKNPNEVGYIGLDETSALMKLRQVGPNALSEKKDLPAIVKYMIKMGGLFNYMLWVGAVFCFIAYGVQIDKRDKSNLILGIVLIGVVVLTATMSYFQESKAASLMA
jgi:sodium/potassium-transporting ATPase subunit alpha